MNRIKPAIIVLLSLVLAVSVSAQGGPVLVNPSFEPPYIEHGAGEVKVAHGWQPFFCEGCDPPHEESQGPTARPEYKPLPKLLDPRRVVEGDTAQAWFLTNRVKDGGVSQRVRVTPGEWYVFSVSLQAWCTNSNDPTISNGEMYAAIGIDPAGREDAFEVGVVWASWEWVGPDHKRYASRTVQAEGEYITVFVRTWNKWRLKHNDIYADAGRLVRASGPGPQPTPQPTQTPQPTPLPCPTCTPGGSCQVDYARIERIIADREPVRWPR